MSSGLQKLLKIKVLDVYIFFIHSLKVTQFSKVSSFIHWWKGFSFKYFDILHSYMGFNPSMHFFLKPDIFIWHIKWWKRRRQVKLILKRGSIYLIFVIFWFWCSLMWHTLCYKWFFRRIANIIVLKYCSVDVSKIYFHCGLESLLEYLELYIKGL